ncbi:unnamed protein product [Prunus brigantina]
MLIRFKDTLAYVVPNMPQGKGDDKVPRHLPLTFPVISKLMNNQSHKVDWGDCIRSFTCYSLCKTGVG